MLPYRRVEEELRIAPRSWLVTGAAGFIGSNLVERLLELDQTVVGLDDFSTGHPRNVEDVVASVGPVASSRFRFIEADLRDLDSCHAACEGVDHVLHQAARGSVPRSIEDPIATNGSNITGFLNILVAARDARVRRFVYAASSSTYGDHPALPKVEDRIGRPLSPYAVTKYVNELYAGVFQRTYGVETLGLRYFNVFGRRQDPDGAYAAVIPRWVRSLLRDEPCRIFGDGETSRDFCYIENVLQANLLAATATDPSVTDEIYNVACGDRTTLNELFTFIRDALAEVRPALAAVQPGYEPARRGDVRHSIADITKARRGLGYRPEVRVAEGIRRAIEWYAENEGRTADPPASERVG